MNDKNSNNNFSKDAEFNIALGWLAALSVSIAGWAGLS